MTCNSIDYQFTKVPTKLYMCLDNNCRSMLFTLIQLSSMYADEQGWFFRASADLEAETKLSRRVIDGTLDALLRSNIIDFIPQQQGAGVKQTSRVYKVNHKTFLNYENISIDDCIKNPKYQIVTSDYKKGSFTWHGKEWVGKAASLSLTSTPTSTPTSSEPQHKVTTSIDNVDNTDTLNNLNRNSLNIFNNIISKNGNDITKEQVNESTKAENSNDGLEDKINDKEQGVVNTNESLDNSNYNNKNNNLTAPCTTAAAWKPDHASEGVHDDCLIYLITHKPPQSTDGYDIKEYYDYCIAKALVKMVKMDIGSLPKNEAVFYEAVNNYMNLYGVSKEQAIKDINILKVKAKKIKDEQQKAVA